MKSRRLIKLVRVLKCAERIYEGLQRNGKEEGEEAKWRDGSETVAKQHEQSSMNIRLKNGTCFRQL